MIHLELVQRMEHGGENFWDFFGTDVFSSDADAVPAAVISH
jgi:hypothetical protein